MLNNLDTEDTSELAAESVRAARISVQGLAMHVPSLQAKHCFFSYLKDLKVISFFVATPRAVSHTNSESHLEGV